jgi:hypothetical protein
MIKQFYVPEDLMTDFAGKLAKKELANEIKGVDDEGDVKVIVHYQADQRYEVFELAEWFENFEQDEFDDEEDD